MQRPWPESERYGRRPAKVAFSRIRPVHRGLPRQKQANVEEQVRTLIALTSELSRGGDISFPHETSMFAYRKL